jgi:hypothetical protein
MGPLPAGEAYSVNVDVRFPQQGLTGIDFGTVRVSDSPSAPIVMKNGAWVAGRVAGGEIKSQAGSCVHLGSRLCARHC